MSQERDLKYDMTIEEEGTDPIGKLKLSWKYQLFDETDKEVRVSVENRGCELQSVLLNNWFITLRLSPGFGDRQ